jgi:hypothetical protein
MLNSKTACELVRSLPDVTEKRHFESDGFYANKRIFATVWHDKKQVNVRLSLSQQRVFLEADGEALIEIPNAWGKQGWTTIQLEFIDRAFFMQILKAAWESSAKKFSHGPPGSRKPVARKKAVKKSKRQKSVK